MKIELSRKERGRKERDEKPVQERMVAGLEDRTWDLAPGEIMACAGCAEDFLGMELRQSLEPEHRPDCSADWTEFGARVVMKSLRVRIRQVQIEPAEVTHNQLSFHLRNR